MRAVISSWLNLEKIIFKSENEVFCSRNEKILPFRKATGSTSRSKQRGGKREN